MLPDLAPSFISPSRVWQLLVAWLSPSVQWDMWLGCQ